MTNNSVVSVHVNEFISSNINPSDGWTGRRDLVVQILKNRGGQVVWPDGFPQVEIQRDAIPRQIVNTGVRIDG